jgi:DNA sulfur modification protein DndB
MANTPLYLPALRCFVGDRCFYASAMTFSQIAERVVRSDQLITSNALNELIQRTITDRSEAIASYIETQGQRFFNSLVLAVFEGEPEWLDIRLLDSNLLPEDVDESSRDTANEKIGLLRLSGSESVFALDGQHRVEGIKVALSHDPELGSEELSVLFVSHKAGAEGKQRTRRLFTTLNRYAKPVSKYEKIALDEDDAMAIVTRQLLNDHDVLKEGRTAYSKGASIASSNHHSVTTLPVVYDIANILLKDRVLDGIQWTPARLTFPRPTDDVLKHLFEEVSAFWLNLADWSPALGQASLLDDAGRSQMVMRSREGGDIVFRPIMQLAIAIAVRKLIDQGDTMPGAFQKLLHVPRLLSHNVWEKVVWDPVGKKMIATGDAKSVASGLLMKWAGVQEAQPNLVGKYRSLVGKAEAELPTL